MKPDEQRAYDHYRWADRYSRQSEPKKAAAHLRRAVQLHRGTRPTRQKFGAPFPAKSDWRKVTVKGEVFELNRAADDEPYSAMVSYEASPDDAMLGENSLIRIPVTYNENSIYAYYTGTSHSIGGLFVATSAKTLSSLYASRFQLKDAIEDTNLAVSELSTGPETTDLALLVLTRLVCDYGEPLGIRPLDPSPLPGYNELVIDGIGVSVNGDFKRSFAREYLLETRAGGKFPGVYPGEEKLRAMREARNMTIRWHGDPRSVGNIHFLQRAYTEHHRSKIDYFVSSYDYQGERKLRGLIFAPYTGAGARARVIRDIEPEVPPESVSAGNLVNGLTIGLGKLEDTDASIKLEPGAVFAIRVFVWCTLIGSEFIDSGKPWLAVSNQEKEMHPMVYTATWSNDTDHTVIVSNNKNQPSIKFKFEDLGADRGPMRRRDHAVAVAAIKEALARSRQNKKPRHS
jgi:hypothetical protein